MTGLLSMVLGRLYDGDLAGARRTLADHAPDPGHSPTCRAWLAYAEGELASAEGDVATASAAFERAIEAGGSVGSRFVVGVSEVSRLAALARGGNVDEALATFVPLLERYRQLGNATHGVTALRNVVVLFVRAGRDSAAMKILGALSDDDTKLTYGSESAEIAAAIDAPRGRHGPGHVDAWLATGAGHDTDWALEQAIANAGPMTG